MAALNELVTKIREMDPEKARRVSRWIDDARADYHASWFTTEENGDAAEILGLLIDVLEVRAKET